MRLRYGAAAVSLIAVLAVAACTAKHPGAAPSAMPSAPALTGERASAMAAGLSSGREPDVRGVVLLSSGQALDPAAAQQLQAAGPITFDLASFRAVDATHATVTGRFANPPDGTPAVWTFDLAWVGGAWMITDTEPAG
ncbi:hypothetical protein [Dactylosporangium darangshiense]|uniref:DUF4878 domain-containing protein n=1 Tax=Dactylosporangium darangshiense TaxID=579108 RepID=A0ABP8DIZ7_9ACTN